jgi:hypothetical protein
MELRRCTFEQSADGLTLRVPDHTTLSRRAVAVNVAQPRRPGTDAGRDAEPLHRLVDNTGLKAGR